MGPALYLIAIMGCGESDAPCREVRVADTRYESQAACVQATPNALERLGDIPFPNVVAQCRRADAGPVLLRGDEVLMPAPSLGRPPTTVIAAAAAARLSR